MRGSGASPVTEGVEMTALDLPGLATYTRSLPPDDL